MKFFSYIYKIIIKPVFEPIYQGIFYRIIITYKHLDVITDEENRTLYFTHVWKLLKRLPRHLLYAYLILSYVDAFLSVDPKEYLAIPLTVNWTEAFHIYWGQRHFKKIKLFFIALFVICYGAWFFLRRTNLYFVGTTFIIPGMFFTIVYDRHWDMFVWAAHVLEYSLVSYYIYAFIWYWPFIIIAIEEQEQEIIDLQFDKGKGKRIVNGMVETQFPVEKYDSIQKYVLAEIIGPYIKPETGIEAPEHFGNRWEAYQLEVEELHKRDEKIAQGIMDELNQDEDETTYHFDYFPDPVEIIEKIRKIRNIVVEPTPWQIIIGILKHSKNFLSFLKNIFKIFFYLWIKGIKINFPIYKWSYLYWYVLWMRGFLSLFVYIYGIPRVVFRFLKYFWKNYIGRTAFYRENSWVLAVGPFCFWEKGGNWEETEEAWIEKAEKNRFEEESLYDLYLPIVSRKVKNLSKKHKALIPLRKRTYAWNLKQKKLAISLFEKKNTNYSNNKEL